MPQNSVDLVESDQKLIKPGKAYNQFAAKFKLNRISSLSASARKPAKN